MTAFRSIIFNIYYFASAAIISIALLPLMLISRKTGYFCAQVWNKNLILAAKYFAGIDYEIKGNIPSAPCIIASKHQSAWETAIFIKILPKAAYVYKRELAYIPIFGWHLWTSGMIAVNRKAGASSIKKLIKDTKNRLSHGFSVVIFPEGTRKNIGDEPDYKPGIAAIYSSLEAEIVPVALNSGRCWPRNSFLKKSGKITLKFLEPIEPGLKKQEFMQELENRIESAMKDL